MNAVKTLKEAESAIIIGKHQLVSAILEIDERLKRVEEKLNRLDKDSHGE